MRRRLEAFCNGTSTSDRADMLRSLGMAALTRVDEAALKVEMIETATAFVRDRMPQMERMAARFLPYYRAIHMRAAATDVPASRAPVRLPCGCHAGFRHTLARG